MQTTAILMVVLFLMFIPHIANGDSSSSAPQLVDINAASADELASALPGIGPAKAARIVKWRNENGLFTHVEQLQEVKGIGPKTVERLRAHARVGSAADAKRTRLKMEEQEQQIRADIQTVIKSARLAAEQPPEQQPARPWYRRSALELLRSH